MVEFRAMFRVRKILASAPLTLLLAIGGCNREVAGDYPAANDNDGLPAISLLDQHGSAVSLASLKGKPVLVDFIYTSSASTCPMLTAKMAAIAHQLGPALGAGVTIVSIALDPEHDTPPGLVKYPKSHDADGPCW